jgi:hypothetical protein
MGLLGPLLEDNFLFISNHFSNNDNKKLLLFWLTIINLLLVASINLPSAREFIAEDCVHFGIGQISYLFARIKLIL